MPVLQNVETVFCLEKQKESYRRHLPALDGLRGVAVLAVFLCHYADSPSPGGWLHTPFWFGWVGVDLFFVLSGFLITGILWDSLNSERYFRNFYIRRTLRIFPLFYLIWAVCWLITPFVHVGWNRYVIAQMFYVGNWTLLGAFQGQHPDPGILMVGKYPLIFGHFWTLCLEEQFYLVWPAVVFLVRRRERLIFISVAGAVLVAGLRCALFLEKIPAISSYLYNASFSRFDSLLIGAALVLWLRGQPAGFQPPRWWSPALFFVPTAILGIALATIGRREPLQTNNLVFVTCGFTLLAISAAGAILAALDERTWISRWLQHPWLVSLGMVSYGFYIFHAIPLRLFYNANLVGVGAGKFEKFVVPVVAFIFFYGLSRLSYALFESRFLKLKDKYAPPDRRVHS